MHCTDQLSIVVAFSIVVAAANTGSRSGANYGPANLIVDTNRFNDTTCSLNGSTNLPEVEAGKT